MKKKLIVKGIYNGSANGSVFSANPFGWLGKEVEIDFPFPEENLELAYKNAVLKKQRLFSRIVVKDVCVVREEEI